MVDVVFSQEEEWLNVNAGWAAEVKVSGPQCSAVTGRKAESAASVVEVEAAGDISRQVQVSWAGSTNLHADAGHTAGLAVLGKIGHGTRIGPLAKTRTTDGPGGNSVANGLMPAG